MKTSSTVTGSGNIVSGGVWLPKGTTLKGIMLIFSSVVNKNYYTSRVTFYTHLLSYPFTCNDFTYSSDWKPLFKAV
jgi:hypothetical protein